jgi:hypothetical protein
MANKTKGSPSLYDVGIANPIHQQIVHAETQQTAAKIQKQITSLNKKVGVQQSSGSVVKPGAQGGDNTPTPTQPDADYKWNLPPHAWSMPVRPEAMDEVVSGDPMQDMEKYRRGRMWWYASSLSDFYTAAGKVDKKLLSARKFGFQFIWNPDTYNTNVSLNMDVTPSPMDAFKGLAMALPSQQSITFTLRIDRTNDFAALRGLLGRNYNSFNIPSANGGVSTDTPVSVFTEAAKYYKTSFSKDITDQTVIAKQIKDLMELGTISDLEYLYKAVNGDNWHNISGRRTSDIGFLSATLLRIDLGPAAYVGYVNSMNITHMAFSQDMTPIRSDVQITMNLMTSAGIGQVQNGQNNPAGINP